MCVHAARPSTMVYGPSTHTIECSNALLLLSGQIDHTPLEIPLNGNIDRLAAGELLDAHSRGVVRENFIVLCLRCDKDP